MIRCEVPDFCASNGRKIAQSIEDVADIPNILDMKARCGPHQAKRIIQNTEKECVGDVHAIIVAGGQVAHAERLWDEFRIRFSNVRIF